jgi:hypothetical protein
MRAESLFRGPLRGYRNYQPFPTAIPKSKTIALIAEPILTPITDPHRQLLLFFESYPPQTSKLGLDKI